MRNWQHKLHEQNSLMNEFTMMKKNETPDFEKKLIKLRDKITIIMKDNKYFEFKFNLSKQAALTDYRANSEDAKLGS
jgi:hypothetical protein